MVYRKKYVKKNKYTAKKKSMKFKVNKAFYGMRNMRNLYRPEYKKYDTSASTSAGTSSTVTTIVDIAQGDTVATRNANRILVKKIQLQGTVQHNNTSTVGQYVKVYLIQDKQQIGDTAPVENDVFDASGINAFLSPNTVGRFKILKCFKIIVDPSNECKAINLFKRTTIPVTFNGTASTDIQKNGLYLFMKSDDNTNKPVINWRCRVVFVDN